MTFAERQLKWSVILNVDLEPVTEVCAEIKGHVLHRVRLQLNVPGSLLEDKVLLTKKLRKFRSRLNENSSGSLKIWAVCEQDLSKPKFRLTMVLSLLVTGWYVKANGMRSLLERSLGVKV